MIGSVNRGHKGRMSSAAAAADAEGDLTESEPRHFSEVVKDHLDFVWRVLRRSGFSREDADDATQQVFMIVANHSERVLPNRERAFLYATARRVAANTRRSMRRRREAMHDAWDDVLHPGSGPETQVELARARELLDRLLTRMPDELGRVLALAEVEQMTVPDIAELEEIPVGTAASRLRRARAHFRELLSAVQHENPFAGES
jgi:RNA polymerase sigma-70 factor (ECF subfamily)